MHTHEKLLDFIRSERERFETSQSNTFAFAFGEVSRYFEYLQIISERYEICEQEFVNNTKAFQASLRQGNHPLTNDQMNLHEQAVEITARLHLEIETFYLFAKILLDKVAQAIEFYFGPARGLPLASHDKLAKFLEQYGQAKGLVINVPILGIVTQLKSDVSDFRDYQISHIEESRRGRVTRGTLFNADGNTRLSIGMLYPKEKDRQYDTKPLNELLDDLKNYIDSVVDFIKTNEAKTCLKLGGRSQK
jgi:hypothetical protein